MGNYLIGAWLTFEATGQAEEVADLVVTRLNDTGRRLDCNASLTLSPGPPREMRGPRPAVYVGLALALSVLADLQQGKDSPLVTLQLRGEVLSVQQGPYFAAFDPRGELVATERPLLSGPQIMVIATASELAEDVARAVANGAVEVALSGRGPGQEKPVRTS